MKSKQTSVRLEAANDGGFVVFAGRQDFGDRTAMLYAGGLSECLNYISDAMRPTQEADRDPILAPWSIKEGE